jgi:hypothetical protein
VPITLVVVLLGLFILWSAHGSRESKWLSAVAIAFAGWVVDILMQWVASYHELLLFSWQLNAIFEVGLFLAGAGFAYVYCYQRGIPDWLMYALGGIGLATLAAIPTSLNIQSYDVGNCQGVVGPLWFIIYAFEPAVVILIAYMGLDAARHTADTTTRHRIALAAWKSFNRLHNRVSLNQLSIRNPKLNSKLAIDARSKRFYFSLLPSRV